MFFVFCSCMLSFFSFRFSRILFDTQCQDTHLYLFSHWVIHMLAEVPSLSSIQTNVIPFLVAGQANSIIQQKLRSAYLAHCAATMCMQEWKVQQRREEECRSWNEALAVFVAVFYYRVVLLSLLTFRVCLLCCCSVMMLVCFYVPCWD